MSEPKYKKVVEVLEANNITFKNGKVITWPVFRSDKNEKVHQYITNGEEDMVFGAWSSIDYFKYAYNKELLLKVGLSKTEEGYLARMYTFNDTGISSKLLGIYQYSESPRKHISLLIDMITGLKNDEINILIREINEINLGLEYIKKRIKDIKMPQSMRDKDITDVLFGEIKKIAAAGVDSEKESIEEVGNYWVSSERFDRLGQLLKFKDKLDSRKIDLEDHILEINPLDFPNDEWKLVTTPLKVPKVA